MDGKPRMYTCLVAPNSSVHLKLLRVQIKAIMDGITAKLYGAQQHSQDTHRYKYLSSRSKELHVCS